MGSPANRLKPARGKASPEKVLRQPLGVRLQVLALFLIFTTEIISGFYIFRPTPYLGFQTMDSARLVHFTAAYLLVAVFLFRIYYILATGYYSEVWFQIQDISAIPGMMLYYLFLAKTMPPCGKYNALQKLLYSSWVVFIAVQIITGFTVYAPARFQRLAALLGGLNHVRYLHFLTAVAIAASSSVHIYLVTTQDWDKLAAMFTGYITRKKAQN